MKRLSLEIPFSGINLTALAWACFYLNLHITYFMLAKHKRHSFNSQNWCNSKIHTKPLDQAFELDNDNQVNNS